MKVTIGELCVLIEGRLRQEEENALRNACLRKMAQFERELGGLRRLDLDLPEPPPEKPATKKRTRKSEVELVEPSEDFWAKSQQPSEDAVDSAGADTDDSTAEPLIIEEE